MSARTKTPSTLRLDRWGAAPAALGKGRNMVKRIILVLALVVALGGCSAQQAQIWWALNGGGSLPLDKAQVFADIYNQRCAPDYFPCLPRTSDVDCAGGSGDGPAYTVPGQQYILLTPGSDPYRLDADGDGVGCDR